MADNRTSSFRAQRVRPGEIDRLIHGRVRLGIMSALATGDRLSFNELKQRLDTSDGNLSVHARKLEEAGYVECIKSFDGRTPKTEYQITNAGTDALRQYIDQMEQLLGFGE
ncbi:transcriptional regulator [Longibacter salinarum]|uniref:Transcriptional regulator n=1 Tax=Longibacter salinarum TaxID=1850348 RepID=A0A2A8CY29_9BACT|nr:transcriptional regulator [Longibacter salinarum]PEN13487.1 transcriptional regulator [Longibacter salinarum]